MFPEPIENQEHGRAAGFVREGGERHNAQPDSLQRDRTASLQEPARWTLQDTAETSLEVARRIRIRALARLIFERLQKIAAIRRLSTVRVRLIGDPPEGID